jgi:hypothetical protein
VPGDDDRDGDAADRSSHAGLRWTTCMSTGVGVKKGPPPRRGERTVPERQALRGYAGALATLSAALATDGGFFLPLPLCTRLLIVPALTQLRVQARALNLPLEATERAVETFVVLYDDFQDGHILWQYQTVERKKLNGPEGLDNLTYGNRPSRWSVCA